MIRTFLEWLWRLIFGERDSGKWSGFDDGPMLSSCWRGHNAKNRMMNMLSPHMPESVLEEYIQWMLDRGCNVAHVILCNEKDGEYGGYCPYGPVMDGQLHDGYLDVMRSRLKRLQEDFATVVWLLTDDGPSFNRKPESFYVDLIADCQEQGLFDGSPLLVLGLELDEYFNSGQVQRLCGVMRQITHKPVGVHQTSDKLSYAAHGDFVLWQTNPGKSSARIKKLVTAAIAKVGNKPLVAFEMARQEARELCEAAIKAGAAGVGNW